jgi:hypothetical protein
MLYSFLQAFDFKFSANLLLIVQISEVLNSPEEGFTVEGMEVGMVVILGRVTSVEKAATKTTYQVSKFTSS